jgi:hypothetical protein
MITFDLTVPKEHHPHLITALRKMKPDPKHPKHKVTVDPGEKKISAVNTDETEMDVEAIGGDVLRFSFKVDKGFQLSYLKQRGKVRIVELLKSEGVTFQF